MVNLKQCSTVFLLRPNKKISVFLVTGLKILGRVGTHFFLEFFFYSFWKAKCLSKCIKLYFFPENLKKILGLTLIFR